MSRKSKPKIIIIANKYPNEIEHNVNVFTQQITWSFMSWGYTCIVICPTAVNYNKQYLTLPFYAEEKTDNGGVVPIYRPRYLGFGQDGDFLQKPRVDMTTRAFIHAVERVIKKFEKDDYVIFSEFLCPAGVAASILGKKYSKPAYMQCGEATYQGDKKYGNRRLGEKLLTGLTGVIALSGQNRDYLLDANVVPSEKIIVLPSGYRKDRIFQRNKKEAREKLNFPLDKFIVGFCGSFDDRKGILRLEKAVDKIEDEDVCLAAVGKGDNMPSSHKCIYKSPLDHNMLSWFYSAVDLFAFPTYHEGSCTAIVEAIACGCPIISSDRAFNYEICDASNSILIEPDDIDAMKDAIIKLKEDKNLRMMLSQGSLEKAKELSLDAKAYKIIQYMNIN